MKIHSGLVVATLLGTLALGTGCATKKQMEMTNLKLDTMSEQLEALLENTRRDSLTQIFGAQTEEIVDKMDKLGGEDQAQFESLMSEYRKGAASIEEVRTGMISVLGGGEREVSTSSGIWLRDPSGEKTEAVSRGTKLVDCHKLKADEIPEGIAESSALAHYDWGMGELDGQKVVFPWEFTMSSFAKEIVENTARRTAQELRIMAGDGEFDRPIYIQVVTDPEGDGVKIIHPTEEGEIYLNKEVPEEK